MTDDLITTSYRQDRLIEERLRAGAFVTVVVILSVLIAIGVVMYELGPVIGFSAGVILFLSALLKPEIALLALTVAAPLVTVMAPLGSLIPGTGITPVNGLMLLVVAGTWAHRYTPRAAAAEATEVDKPLLLFLAWSACSMLVSTAMWQFDATGFGEWIQFAAGYLTFWVVRRRWYSEPLARFAVWLVLAMVLYQSWAVYRLYKDPTLNTAAFNWELKKKITGTFPSGNSNDVGAYLSCYGLVALGMFMGLRKSLLRWPALLVFLAASAATFMTYSRGAQFGLVVGGLCMALYGKKQYILPIAILLAMLPAMLPGAMAERFLDTTDSSAESRKDVWKRAIKVTLMNPVVGVGWRGYYKHQDYAGYKLRDPHNMYLLVSAEQGLPGVTLFLLVLSGSGAIIMRAIKQKKDAFTEALAIGLFGALACFMVNNVFGSRMLYMYVVQHFFLLLGILVILSRPPPDVEAVVESGAVPAPKPEVVSVRRPSPWRYRSHF